MHASACQVDLALPDHSRGYECISTRVGAAAAVPAEGVLSHLIGEISAMSMSGLQRIVVVMLTSLPATSADLCQISNSHSRKGFTCCDADGVKLSDKIFATLFMGMAELPCRYHWPIAICPAWRT